MKRLMWPSCGRTRRRGIGDDPDRALRPCVRKALRRVPLRRLPAHQALNQPNNHYGAPSAAIERRSRADLPALLCALAPAFEGTCRRAIRIGWGGAGAALGRRCVGACTPSTEIGPARPWMRPVRRHAEIGGGRQAGPFKMTRHAERIPDRAFSDLRLRRAPAASRAERSRPASPGGRRDAQRRIRNRLRPATLGTICRRRGPRRSRPPATSFR